MKNHKTKLLILFFLGCCLFISCKKGAAEHKNILAIASPVTNVDTGLYIPAKLTTGKSETTFSYTTTNVLAKIKFENGDSTILEFTTAAKPKRIKRYKNGVLVSISFFTLDTNGLITNAERYSVDINKKQDLTGVFDLGYNSEGKVNLITYYDNGHKLLYTQQFSYGPTGNLIAQTSTEATLKANYAYDLKNALFKNVGNAWLFELEKENNLFLSAVNNIKSCTYPANTAANSVTTYAYNTANFPKTINSTVMGVTAVTNVTYK